VKVNIMQFGLCAADLLNRMSILSNVIVGMIAAAVDQLKLCRNDISRLSQTLQLVLQDACATKVTLPGLSQ